MSRKISLAWASAVCAVAACLLALPVAAEDSNAAAAPPSQADSPLPGDTPAAAERIKPAAKESHSGKHSRESRHESHATSGHSTRHARHGGHSHGSHHQGHATHAAHASHGTSAKHAGKSLKKHKH